MMKRFSRTFSVRPLLDLQRDAEHPGGWIVTGGDPQFSVQEPRFGSFAPGPYKIEAVGGLGLAALDEAYFYLDFGSGYSEDTKIPILFQKDADGKYSGYCWFKEAVRSIRFDPAAGARPRFALTAFRLQRLSDANWKERSVALPTPVEERGEGARRLRMVMNLTRLLPSSKGAGGAGRVCKAFLTYLPDLLDLRVLILPHHAELVDQHPRIDFRVVTSDDTAQFRPHFEWCDCYFDPLNALRPVYIPSSVPVLGCVLDLQHMWHPTFFSDEEVDMRLREYRYVVDRADLLVAISNFERQNLATFYDIQDSHLLYLSGFAADDSRLTRQDLDFVRTNHKGRPYLIYPAVPWVHKNHEALIQAIALLRRRGLDIPVMLTNTGSNNARLERLTDLTAQLGVVDLFDFRAFLDESTLLHYLVHSVGLVFPSLYEGFGIPLVDAMKLGVPCLAGSSASISEVCGDACAYFANERNPISMAADIEAFWNNQALRAELVEKGYARGERFSSHKMAQDLFAAASRLVEAHKAQTRDCKPSRKREVGGPRMARLAVLVVLETSPSEKDLETLRGYSDINRDLSRIFGTGAEVTFATDIAILDDELLRDLCAGASRTILFDGSKPGALDAVVKDFSARYDGATHQLVTGFSEASLYRPDLLELALMALDREPHANYAVLNPNSPNVVLSNAPSEIEGALEYDKRRKSGFAVRNAIIRRGGPLSGLKNGEAAFLSALATRGVALQCPG